MATDLATTGEFVWRPTPEAVDKSRMMALVRSLGCKTYDEMLAKAEKDPEWFWGGAIKAIDFRFYKPYTRVMDGTRGKPWTDWFIGGTTNAYLNLIEKHKGTPVWNAPALAFEGEDGRQRSYTYAELDAEAGRLANALKALGVKTGDVVGLFLPMIPEVFISWYAVARIGAIAMPLFSGFGPEPIAVRVNESKAKVIICADGTWRRGVPGAMKSVLDQAAKEAPSIEKVICVRHLGDTPGGEKLDTPWVEGRDLWWHDFVARQSSDVKTAELPAESPLTLIFTSGTTGKPKGVIQTHVGFISKIAIDVTTCCDIQQGDRIFWLSDFGWMVGTLVATATTYVGGSVFTAEGAPDYPDQGRFWRLIQNHKVTHFGIAPTAARGVMRYGVEEPAKYDLSSLKGLITAGEPSTPDEWGWLFEHICKKKLPMYNISGGTEIGSSIVTCTSIQPMKPCGFSGTAPGAAAAVFNENGERIKPGEVGELVVMQPNPAMTKGFWGPDGKDRYLDAYWRVYPDVWRHGDFATIDKDGAWFLLGRSDDTLKISGKRTGPAELEGILMETGKLAEVAVIGLPDSLKGEAVGVVGVPAKGVTVNDALVNEISNALVAGMGRSYRPREVHFVADLPKTRSLKIMRRLIRAILLDQSPGDTSSLVNPEALSLLRALKEPR
ncbi:MAG: AMP-binding protein [Alphaproteobacteria bacterium]